jgi:hypothetical protein
MPEIKVNRFSRSKKQPEVQQEPSAFEIKNQQSELQPIEVPIIETKIKKTRGRPKKEKINDVQDSQQEVMKDIQEDIRPPTPQSENNIINYDDMDDEHFLEDLNSMKFQNSETLKTISQPNINKPSTNLELLEKIKNKNHLSSADKYISSSLSNESLLEKIKAKSKKAIKEDNNNSLFSKEGTEIIGKDKRILLSKIQQYKSLFPELFQKFKIKFNATTEELQAYLSEMDSIVECDSVESFLLDSILQCIKLIEGVSSLTRYDIQGLADLLKQNKQFHQLSKQLFIKYKVFNAVPPETQLIFLVATSAYICNSKNRRKNEIESYLNQPVINPEISTEEINV